MEKPVRQLKMMVGYVGSGKTTYIKNHPEKFEGYVNLSSDDSVQKRCIEIETETGIMPSMDEIYQNKKEMNLINQKLEQKYIEALKNGENIIIDDTGKYKKNRNSIIQKAKLCDEFKYETTAIFVYPPEQDEHIKSLWNRSIKERRLSSMNSANISKGIEPLEDNEFDHVEYVGTPPDKPLFHEYRTPVSLADAIKDAKDCGEGRCR